MPIDEESRIKELVKNRKLEAKTKGYPEFLLQLWEDSRPYEAWLKNGHRSHVPDVILGVTNDSYSILREKPENKRNTTRIFKCENDTTFVIEEKRIDGFESQRLHLALNMPNYILEIRLDASDNEIMTIYKVEDIESYIPGVWETSFSMVMNSFTTWTSDQKLRAEVSRKLEQEASLKKKFGID